MLLITNLSYPRWYLPCVWRMGGRWVGGRVQEERLLWKLAGRPCSWRHLGPDPVLELYLGTGFCGPQTQFSALIYSLIYPSSGPIPTLFPHHQLPAERLRHSPLPSLPSTNHTLPSTHARHSGGTHPRASPAHLDLLQGGSGTALLGNQLQGTINAHHRLHWTKEVNPAHTCLSHWGLKNISHPGPSPH